MVQDRDVITDDLQDVIYSLSIISNSDDL